MGEKIFPEDRCINVFCAGKPVGNCFLLNVSDALAQFVKDLDSGKQSFILFSIITDNQLSGLSEPSSVCYIADN